MSCRNGARFLPAAAIGLLVATGAAAQVNPFSVIGSVVATAFDVRTRTEVANDVEIAAGANKRLADDKQAEWKGVTLLVFAQHVVIAGAVTSEAAKNRDAEVVRQDKRIRSLVNDLVVIQKAGDDGSFVKDKTIDTKIDAALTSSKGIGSVNMRWKTVNGNVVLMGVALTADEAKRAVATTRSIDGVKSVKSHLRVVPKK